MQKFKVNGQLVTKIEWKKRTDGWTYASALSPSLMHLVKINDELSVAARPLKIKLVECDGGSMYENTTAANVLLSHDFGMLASLLLNLLVIWIC